MVSERSEPSSDLRARAEALLAISPAQLQEADAGRVHGILHELQTHQIELELQNEELRRAQLELTDARDRLADLYDFAPVGYATTSEKGIIITANLTLADLLGVERGRLIRARLTSYILAQDQDVYYRHRNRLKEPGERGSCEVRLRREGAEPIWVHIDSIAEVAEGERRIRSALSDISRSKLAEEERGRVEQRMQNAQRLEALGVLAGGIAHDFNNLLAVILGNSELALTRMRPGEPARANVANALQASKRAGELVSQLLAHAGKRWTEFQPTELGGLAREMADLLRTSASKKAEIRFDIGDALPNVLADPTQIRQVVLNLVTNAAESVGDASGEVVVRVSRQACDRSLLDAVRPDEHLPVGDYVCVSVRDTGSGMDARTLARVFDPFFSTKFTGRGLGLAAAHGIVSRHRGAIRAESQPGKGSLFEIYLPATGQPIPHEQGTPRLARGWRGSGTVLVVDDEESLRDLTGELLGGLGFEVLMAKDGEEAVEVFRERAADLACVLLDCKMPKLDGPEAFHLMHQIDPGVPVVLLSGYDEADVSAQLTGEGLAGFVHKPFTLADLRSALRRVVPGG